MPTPDKELKATFEQARTTPGTFVFKEQVGDGDLEISGSFYLKKAAANVLDEPEKITITVTAVS